MTEDGDEQGWQVSLLVPHPTRLAVLVGDNGLPTLRTGPEPPLSEILASVDAVDPATAVPLRLSMTAAQAEGVEAALVLEFDAVTADPPAGWAWRDLDAESIARLEPADARGAVSSWCRERVDGWSPRRPVWSRSGWFARASAWMLDRMAAAGHPATDAPRVHYLWGVSVVLRAPSSDGAFFLKCSGDIFRHEAMTTRALAAQLPDAFPEVVAVDASEGWLLMCDLGAPELGEQAQSLWHEGLVTHAGVQRSWLGRADELVGLGLPDRSLTALADEVGEISDDDTVQSRMDPELRDRWRSSAPSLVAACLRLEEIGPGPSLVHGDLHPWNVTYGSGTTRIFDWTDAAVSHPFVDLPTYLFRTDDVAVRRRMVDAYLDAWSTAGSPAQLREAADLAVIVGSLYQVQTYRVLIPTLMNDGADDDLADGDLSWIRRTLARLECGLDGPDGAD
jgi:hypothetical protein